MTPQKVRQIVGRDRGAEHRRRVPGRAPFGKPVEAFKIVGTTAARIAPPVSLVDIVARKSGRRPVMTFGACGGVDEEAVKQPEAQRERSMVGSYVLCIATRKPRGFTRAKDR